jgi:ATP-binding cassette, subfamily B, bacterial PglK
VFKYLAKIFYILPDRHLGLIPLIVSFIFVSILEVFGIGIIGPFIGLASKPELIEQTSWLKFIFQQSGISEKSQFIALIGLGIILIFGLKSFFSWRVQTAVFHFAYKQKGDLTTKLMKAYLAAPYTFHLSKNSSHIIHNIITETKQFANAVLIPLLTAISNCFILLSLIILLTITNLATIVVILGTILPLFFLFNSFKSKITLWGKEASQAEQATIRIINHGIGAIKETKVIGCEPYFEAEIAEEARKYLEATSQYYAYKLSPRVMVETLLVIFLIGFVSIFLIINNSIQDLTATLSVFALASIRLIPAFTNITNGIGTLKNSSFAVNQLYFDLKEIENLTQQERKRNSLDRIPESKLKFEQKIALQQITYQYPQASENALDRLSLTIKKGESIALIGKSGAGKTTLVDVILGLLIPQQGDLQVDNHSIYPHLAAWQNLIGYIPQSIFLLDDSIEKNIAFGIPEHLIDRQQLQQAIQAAQLEELIERLPQGMKTIVGERGVLLSGGQRQRIGIARALYHGREILVLDEATAALDNETESLVTEAISSLAGTKTMIIIAHRLTTVEHCDRIYELQRGQILRSGSYQEIVLGETTVS